MRKNLYLGIAFMAAAAICLVLLFAGAGISQEAGKLFFEDWQIEKSTLNLQGFSQNLYRNPDQIVAIKSVVAIVSPDGSVLAYWFFQPEPKVFILKDGKYEFDAKAAKSCLECHDGKKLF